MALQGNAINPFPLGAVEHGRPITVRASSGGPKALRPWAGGSGKGSIRRWLVTPKFYPGVARARPFSAAWAVGVLHLQTPMPPQMPTRPRGAGGTGHPSPSASPGCHPGRCLCTGLRDTRWLQVWNCTALSYSRGHHVDVVLAPDTWGEHQESSCSTQIFTWMLGRGAA